MSQSPSQSFPPQAQVFTSLVDTSFYWRVVVPLEQNSNPYSESERLFKIMKVGYESKKPIFRVDFITEKLMFRIYYPCISNSPGTDPRSYTFNRRFSCKKRDVCQVPSALMTCMLKSLFTDLSFRLLTQIVIRSKFWIFQSPPFSDKSLAYAHALFRLSACNLGHSVSLLFFRKYICLP